jgi:hypothetical protein
MLSSGRSSGGAHPGLSQVVRCIASVQDDREAPCEGVLEALNGSRVPFIYYLTARKVQSAADMSAHDATILANASWLLQGRGSLFLARMKVRPSRAKWEDMLQRQLM